MWQRGLTKKILDLATMNYMNTKFVNRWNWHTLYIHIIDSTNLGLRRRGLTNYSTTEKLIGTSRGLKLIHFVFAPIVDVIIMENYSLPDFCSSFSFLPSCNNTWCLCKMCSLLSGDMCGNDLKILCYWRLVQKLLFSQKRGAFL